MTTKPVFLTAKWQNLLMANYVVDPEILDPWLPYGTAHDTFDGHCFLSLVAFEFNNTRVKKIAFPWHKNFVEINLRMYVKRMENNQLKRGVVFIKEIVPRHLISFFANTLYNENYVTMPTGGGLFRANEHDFVGYTWGKKYSMEAKLAPEKKLLIPGDISEFITEHYWGYASINNNSTYEYAVEHPRWETRDIIKHTIQVDFATLYGDTFAFLNDATPHSVLLACGSDILVRHPNKIKL